MLSRKLTKGQKTSLKENSIQQILIECSVGARHWGEICCNESTEAVWISALIFADNEIWAIYY